MSGNRIIRVIRLENIGVLEFHNEKVSYITPEKYKTISKHNVTAGDAIESVTCFV